MFYFYNQRDNSKWTFKNMFKRRKTFSTVGEVRGKKFFWSQFEAIIIPLWAGSRIYLVTDLTGPSSLFIPCRNSFWGTGSSATEEGLSLSAASKGWAALELLLSSEDEDELWQRMGTCRLRCWVFLSTSIPPDLFSHSFLFMLFTWPTPTNKSRLCEHSNFKSNLWITWQLNSISCF